MSKGVFLCILYFYHVFRKRKNGTCAISAVINYLICINKLILLSHVSTFRSLTGHVFK